MIDLIVQKSYSCKDNKFKLNNNTILYENIKDLSVDFRYQYLCNISLLDLEVSELCILVGFNPRLEMPLLNIRIKKAVKYARCSVFRFSYMYNLFVKLSII